MKLLITIFLIISLPITAYSVDITLTGNLDTGTYAAYGNLKTQNSCVIKAGKDVTLQAWYTIELNSGFSVEKGAHLSTSYLGDPLPPDWEHLYFGHINVDPSGDPDYDGLTNLMEYKMNTHPKESNLPTGQAFVDIDNDGLPDYWEWDNFGLMSYGTHHDPDSDGLTNIMEYKMGLNPALSNIIPGKSFVDTDSDGMADYWEWDMFSTLSNGAGGDLDGDGLTNLEEFQYRTHPLKVDSDGDHINDNFEISLGSDPTSQTDFPPKGNNYVYDELGRILKIIRVK